MPKSYINRNPGKKRIVGIGVNIVEIRQPAKTEFPFKRPRIITIIAFFGITTEKENLRDRRISPPFVVFFIPNLPKMATEKQNSRNW